MGAQSVRVSPSKQAARRLTHTLALTLTLQARGISVNGHMLLSKIVH